MKPVCLITGAAGHLGRDLCETLQENFHVVGVYHSKKPSLSSEQYAIQADLTCRDDVQRIIDVTLDRFGQIDALINAAADIKFHGKLRDLWLADDYPQSQLLLNSIVPMQLASAIYQSCWKKQTEENARWNRSVVNISSISALYVFEERGQAFYGVSKAALNMLTLYLSLEMAPFNVRANAICPSRFVGKAATRRVSEATQRLLLGNETGEIVTKIC